MKSLIIFFFSIGCLILFNSEKLFSQNIIQVALNVNDCNVCIEHLKKLKDLNSSYPIKIVAKESERDFKNDIINLIKLENRSNVDFVFNNELYDSLILKGNISSINIFNKKYNTSTKKYSLKNELDDKLIAYLNSLNNDTAIFAFNRRFDMIASENIVYNNNNNTGYSYSGKMPHVLRLNFIDKKVDTFLSIDAAGIKQTAYNQFFKNASKIQDQLNFFKKNNVSESSIQKIIINASGNVVLSLHYNYYAIKGNNKDTTVKRFTAIQEFSTDGKLLATRIVNLNKLSNLVDSSCYIRATDFALDGDTLLFSLVYPKYGKNDKKVDNFLAKFAINNSGDYEFCALDGNKLPRVYDNYGYFYTQPIFSNDLGYIGLLLSDSICGFKGNKDVYINIFKQPQYSGDKFEFKYNINSIDQFGEHLFITYYDKTDGLDLFLVKYSLKNNRIELKKKLIDRLKEDNLFFMFFDKNDPDYYYLKTGSNLVKRIKL